MKRLLLAIPFLMLGGLAYGAGGFVGSIIDSGTFQTISSYQNDDGGSRQAVLIGARSSSTTVPVDGLNGMAVYITTGTGVVVPTSGTISNVVKVDGSAVIQPVSGTITANQGTGNAKFWGIDLSTGVNVNGTFWQAIQPISGTVTGNQGTAGTSFWGIDLSTGVLVKQSTAGTSAWKVDFSTGVQVNGAVTSNQGTAGTSAWKIDASTGITVVGNVASGAADSGNSVKIGGIGRTTYQTAVTDGQRADAQLDSEGKQVFMPYAVPALSTQGVTAAMTGTTDVVVLSSGGANISTYITHLLCTNSHATVGTVINIKNGVTTWYTGYAVAAGGGFSATFPTPLRGATNSQWTATNATNASNTYCNFVGYFAKN